MEEEKLKTLKDIEIKCQKEQDLFRIEDVELNAKELKAEAVKWVKHYRKVQKKFNDMDYGFKAQALQDFFDLTEEDLK